MDADEKYVMREQERGLYECDYCLERCDPFMQEKTAEGDWCCPKCAEEHTCAECGTISYDVELHQDESTGLWERLCPEHVDILD